MSLETIAQIVASIAEAGTFSIGAISTGTQLREKVRDLRRGQDERRKAEINPLLEDFDRNRIEEISKAIELVDHLKWQTFHLIGHSMGGMVLQFVAASVPSRIKSGVAITPLPACGAPQMDAERRQFLLKAGESKEGLALFFMGGTANRHSMAWAQSMAQKSLDITDPEVYAKYTLAWADTNFVQKVLGVQVPLKVLVGDHDTITAEMIQQTILKWFPNSELEVLSNCGHYPMFEIPINLATISLSFMIAHK